MMSRLAEEISSALSELELSFTANLGSSGVG